MIFQWKRPSLWLVSLKNCLLELRTYFLSKEDISIQGEIVFFKELKPQLLKFPTP